MMKLPLLFSAILPVLICQGQADFIPSFQEATSLVKIDSAQEYTFGYLEVLEDRTQRTGNTIQLPVYIFKSRNPNPPEDPILYTVGGPGYTSMRAASYMQYYQYLDDRDFILFEQRGTQYAQPHLSCPEWSQAVYQANMPECDAQKADSLFSSAATACKKRLVEQGINLNRYNTNAIAADIEDLRKTLEIDQYNLLTISYSTKIAQVLMRDFPQHIRSVIMDSPLPLEVNYDEESVANLLEAIDKLLSDCARDTACNRAFPELNSRFRTLLNEKTENPIEVSVQNPTTEKAETFSLSGKDLVSVFTSVSTNGVPTVPMRIQQLLDNDFSWVKERISGLFKNPGNGAGIGMRLSVWCAEEYPFTSRKVIERETNRYPETQGLKPSVFDASICEQWGVESVSEVENQAVKSDIPVLLISGEYDNETPPKWAEAMRQNLTNSYHLIFKGWKHTPTTNWGNPCAMEMANAFFNDPTLKPKLPCFEKIQTPIFKTHPK